MHKHLLLFAVALLSLASCSSTSRLSDQSKALGGTWHVTAIGDSLTEAQLATSDKAPFLVFDITKGNLAGYAGCNRMASSIDKKLLRKGRLELSAIGVTRMLCRDMQVEQALLEALGTVKTYAIVGDTLRLHNADGATQVTLVRDAR